LCKVPNLDGRINDQNFVLLIKIEVIPYHRFKFFHAISIKDKPEGGAFAAAAGGGNTQVGLGFHMEGACLVAEEAATRQNKQAKLGKCN
jgi:hypothetical protein